MLFDVDAENSAALRFVNADMGTDLSGNALLGENDTTQTVTFVVRKETYLIDTINLIILNLLICMMNIITLLILLLMLWLVCIIVLLMILIRLLF